MKLLLPSFLFFILAVLLSAPLSAESTKPNVIVILVDDLGYADLGIQGAKDILTPNIDSIAKNGIQFTQGYVSCPYCAPSRAGINTGRYQTRFGFEYNEPLPEDGKKFGLPLSEKTLGDWFKAEGYKTFAIGKWHLGYSKDLLPPLRGYDEYYGSLSGASSYFLPQRFMDSRKQGKPEKITDPDFYTTEAYGERAVEFIKQHKGSPYFLYLAFNAVHKPMEARQTHLDRFPHIEDPIRKTFAGVLSALDDAVGRVLTTLRETQQEENTLIFFLSDNGAAGKRLGWDGSYNGIFRGAKCEVWEGGIHIPFFIQWKGRLPSGKVDHRPIISLDILPTAIAAAGGKIADDWKIDGVNLLPFLESNNTAAPHDHLCWRLGPQWAIRQGKWKLIQGFDESFDSLPHTTKLQINLYTVTQPLLFDLDDDAGEKKDLAAENPDKVAELIQLYQKWNAANRDPLWIQNPYLPKKNGQVEVK
jgi:arylsulfatase A-like enzyme